MAQAGVQAEARHHGGGTRGHRRARTERGAAGFLRTAVAYGGVAIGRGLPAGGRHQLEHADDFLLAQEAQGSGWHWHQAGANPVRRGSGSHPAATAGGGVALSIPLHSAGGRPGNGVSPAVRRPENQGRVAAFVSVCVGGTGFEVRLPGAVRAAGVGAQFQGGA